MMIDNTGNATPSRARATSLDTLDEAVYKTLLRDLQRVAYKLFHVLLPRGQGTAALRDWDLWGPLLLCLLLASTLASEARESQAPLVFATVFVIVWVGAGVVTVNALLLGGTMYTFNFIHLHVTQQFLLKFSSFFQSVCVLGYCVAPLVIAAVVCKFLLETVFTLKFVVIFAAYLWATTASVGFLAALVPEKRKLLATYPVGLFYLVMAWMILVQ